MIPRLPLLFEVHRDYQRFLDMLLRRGFSGDISGDLGSRLSVATDNSVYQILPQAVVFPRSQDDISLLARIASEPGMECITFAARGGGTGTNGQSLTQGVVVDVSRHMTDILEVNLKEGWVRVEPGVVLDELNQMLAPHGVFFAPNLSPSNRATIGGMVNTDACGKGSRIYGRTSQHIVSLDLVLHDGQTLKTGPMKKNDLEAEAEKPGLSGDIHREVHQRVQDNQTLIQSRFPKLSRFVTGYNLARVWDSESGTFDLNYLIAGSEGTLAFVTEAKLRLSPLPTQRVLVALRYGSFDDALGSAKTLLTHDPGAIETLDSTILELARKDIIYHRVGPLMDPEGHPPAQALNLVEFEGQNADEVENQVQTFIDAIEKDDGSAHRPTGFIRAKTEEERLALWDLRKKGVGLLGASPGARKPVAFVEDTVVPPERLVEYVAAFRKILDEAGLQYGMYGHVDVGCLHVRPALDLKDPADEKRLRAISDQVAALVQSFGGMMWGEHGKGYRSEYNPAFFGPELYETLCHIKGVFDPRHVLNPGKLATPLAVDHELVSVDGPKRGAQDRMIPPHVRQTYDIAIDCNGNGQCFTVNADDVMCPSSKVTRDRIHSPKGRAGLMREWLRQLSVADFDPVANLKKGGSNFLARLFASLGKAFGGYDYSHEVYRAMDGCLVCKACATECPIKVDVPRFRTDFLSLYHSRYLRPLRDHLVAGLESLLPKLARWPKFFNALLFFPPLRVLMQKTSGLVDMPRLSTPVVQSRLQRLGVPPFTMEKLKALDASEREKTVVFIQDAFTSFYAAELLEKAVAFVMCLGFQVHVMPYRPSGKGAHVKGFLGRFEKEARAQAQAIGEVMSLGLPMVGLEPAVVLFFRDEVAGLVGDEATGQVQLLQEWLEQSPDILNALSRSGEDAKTYRLLGHCTEKTASPPSQAQWQKVFLAVGLCLDTVATGCCGMCGAFGHEVHHLKESKGIFELSWSRVLDEGKGEDIEHVATGYSCRSQVKRFRGERLRHPVEVLYEITRPDKKKV